MPWGIIVQVGMQLIGLLISDKARRDQLALQMFDFAKRFDTDSIDNNEKLRSEYERIKKDLA